ncbi:MAG: DUF3048 domain-containing protein [Acidimicrobiia bacterium]
MKTRSPGALLVVATLVAGSCSGSGTTDTTTTASLTTLPPLTTTTSKTTTIAVSSTTTTAPPTTTTSSTTTTTTTIPLPPSPLNGLGAADETTLDRRVLAVKIDNHPDARPQSGLQEADAVYELLVEAGLTRFIALFLQSDSAYVGPIRSVRPTDPTLVRPLNATMQISGGQAWVKSIVRAADVPYIGETDPNTFRIPRNGRAYERTLFGTTDGMRERADRLGFSDEPPEPWFEFADTAEPAGAATSITLEWSTATTVRWDYDGERYLRFAGNDPHNWEDVEGGTGQIAFDTLLVLTARRYTARPRSGQSGSSVPALDTVGSGQAILFTDGGVVEATWQRSSLADPFELRTNDGARLAVPPGSLWVSVFPTIGTLTWE